MKMINLIKKLSSSMLFLVLFILASSQLSGQLVITEIMYNTSGTDDEWIEICNIGSSTESMVFKEVWDGSSSRFTFPAGSDLLAGDCVTIALGDNGVTPFNPGCGFIQNYGTPTITNVLSNSAENISLRNGAVIIDEVNYDDADGADGNDKSLHVIDASMDNSTTGSNWQEVDGGGSPGANWLVGNCEITSIEFVSLTSSISEGGGSIDVCVLITNPSGLAATTFDVDLSGTNSATNGTDYTMMTFPQSLSFPALTTTEQCLTFTITDDIDVESDETIDLLISNVAGGNTAVVGTNSTFSLTITDNEAACAISSVASSNEMCSGLDFTFEVSFTAVDGSGNYDVIDASNGNAVLASGTSSPITVTLSNNSSTTPFDVNVWDNADNLCIGTAVTVTPVDCASCSITGITSSGEMCTGPNFTFDVAFTSTNGSGVYEVIDVTNGNAVVGEGTGPTITVTLMNNTANTTFDINVRDKNDNLCIGTAIAITPEICAQNGINCWDLNGNGINDPAEDVNMDMAFDALDCQGAAGMDGAAGTDGAMGMMGTAGTDGLDGIDGVDGVDGASAYDAWITAGNQGTEMDFLASLVGAAGMDGADGTDGAMGMMGTAGTDGVDGIDGVDGVDGVDGASAYDAWITAGNQGTEMDFLVSLVGAAGMDGTDGTDGAMGMMGTAGTDGVDGIDGIDGVDGASAYDAWITAGNQGTEMDFLVSLEGADGVDGTDGAMGMMGTAGTDGIDGIDGVDGVDGASAYDTWIAAGNQGTEMDFLVSLEGADGVDGSDGAMGMMGTAGTDGVDGVDGAQGIQGPAGDPATADGNGIYSGDGTTASNTTVTITDILNFDGDIAISGQIFGLSDERLKTNKAQILNALVLLNRLNPVTYNFNTEKFENLNLPEYQQYGLLAQEVEVVLPELVSLTKFANGEEFKSVNYNALISILVSAVNDQQDQIDELNIKYKKIMKLLEEK